MRWITPRAVTCSTFLPGGGSTGEFYVRKDQLVTFKLISFFSIDATEDDRSFGRLINHSRLQPNLQPKAILLDGVARIILVANQDILPGMELLYDYGDRDPASILAHPWLAT